ncbi:hypothetical protein VNI00_013936 [Paramarasmius palmivorus]|uniref:Uncharacterized protein n=1 Tax=Paramarasmius palmivorus TaxID=297713 RepID=A0AAW0BX98_9AGAR
MGGFALYDGDDFQQYLWDRQDFYKEGDVPGNRSSREPSTSSAEPEAQAVDSELSEIKVAVEIERMKRKNAGLRVLNTDQEFNTIAQEIRKDYTCLLEFLIAKGHIIITEKDIQDNLSHADALSKTIAVMQVSWFILQFLARAVERLAITEIEVIALGYAVLNLVTYGLWWNKPLGVRHPVRVTWRQHERQPHHLDCQKERLPERVRKSHQDFQQTVLTAIPPLRHLHDWSDNRLSSRWKRVTDHRSSARCSPRSTSASSIVPVRSILSPYSVHAHYMGHFHRLHGSRTMHRNWRVLLGHVWSPLYAVTLLSSTP